MESRTFRGGVLDGHDSIKGFRLVATNGDSGRVSWASYAPGESYLVVALGHLGRKHHVVPAGAVTAVKTGEVHVGLSREQIQRLPDVARPDAPLDSKTWAQTIAAFEREYSSSFRI